MSTITARIDTTISTIPLLRHRDTVINFPVDQDDFVTKYEATNDHLSISTVPQINAVRDQIDLVASQMNIVAGEVNDNAGIATTKAAEALASANAAALSATNALNSENAAAALLDSFDDRYLGAKAVEPTLDNDGNALLSGALYYNTVSDDTRMNTSPSYDAMPLAPVWSIYQPPQGQQPCSRPSSSHYYFRRHSCCRWRQRCYYDPSSPNSTIRRWRYFYSVPFL